ncbi:MarR family transcriptional regulator [Actinomadura barringtoniae]|uniref:MarR family transcriptional regulator n=1 Tax=Actinomadura barringtoniae TaxID=1427535 RepID=A0A939P6Y1_9ACTN|nr:MarR family transcriptional regulator [Actinomadura barringtoniae]MBO2446563.1 MarR family transcriptional regulator [Actinomadura barringtoniae]
MTTDDDDDFTPPVAPPASALADYLGYLLSRAFKRASACGRAAMPDGRVPRELGVLSVLSERGPISQRKLGEVLGVNRTIMVKLIDGMERGGLVSRERDPDDRRSYRVTPLPAATEALAEMGKAAVHGEAELVSALTPAEHQRLVELLTRLLPDSAEPPERFAGRTGYLLAATHLQLRERGLAEMRVLGIDPRDFGVLAIIAALEPCSQQQVAREMAVSSPAVVGAVHTLHHEGFIERDRKPDDRREHVLRLTAEGRAVLARAREITDRIHAEVAERLTGEGLEELKALLIKII